MPEVPRVTMSDPRAFYDKYVAAAKPVVLAGAATAATSGVEWTDEFLARWCHLDESAGFGRGGKPWSSIIEVNKIIVSNTRYPLLNDAEGDVNFCTFVRDYLKPENADNMYLVSPLTDPGVQIGKHVQMPSVLRCPEIHDAVHDTRLWMSSGNTSSSLHFDTHENLMLQVFGTKSVYFWPPSESHKLYMDYHDRFGLSPVHPDRVDVDKWPMFAQLEGGMVAHLHAGDALLIPDGWWHQVRTWPGRNAAVTWEFEPFEGLDNLWPRGPEGEDLFQTYLRDDKWSSQTRLKYSMKTLVTMRGGPIACNESVPAATADQFKCNENQYTAEFCNFRCMPNSCVTQQIEENLQGHHYGVRF